MGRIASILSFLRVTKRGAEQSEVKLDPGGEANLTAQSFAPAGDDSQPLPGDYAITSDVPQTGGVAAVGYVDPVSPAVAGPGESRRYARDSSGATMSEQWLKSDGTAISLNANGSIELMPDGSVRITTPHGVNTLNADGSVSLSNGGTVTASGDYISATGISLNNHRHIGNLGSPTGPPIV